MNVTIGRKSYEIPSLTMDVMEAIDGVSDSKERRDTFEGMWCVLLMTIGEDATREVAKGDCVGTCDLIALTAAYSRVCNAYMTPLVKEQASGIREQVRELQPAIDAMRVATSARSGFSLVK